MSTRRRQPARKPLTREKRAQLRRSTPSGSIGEASRVAGFALTAARHGLTAAQCQQGNTLLRRLERERPIREGGARGSARRALRVAGVLSAIRRGVVGDSRFGYALHGHWGGKVMALHGRHILRANGVYGHLSVVAQARKAAAAHWETTGEVLPLEEAPPRQTPP